MNIESDLISITDSTHPLTSTISTGRRKSSSLLKKLHSRTKSASIAIEPVDVPALEGQISRRSLARTLALLNKEPVKLTKNSSKYDFMAEVARIYDHTIRVSGNNDTEQANQEERFNMALERHLKNANDSNAKREFKSLTESGHLPSHTMYAATLRYRRETKAALAHLYAGARIMIDLELRLDGPVFADLAKAMELRFALSEIARTFTYPSDTTSLSDARAFYAIGADLGDWQGMYQLGGCYLYGEGGEQNKEIGKLLIARSKIMRNEFDTVVEE